MPLTPYKYGECVCGQFYIVFQPEHKELAEKIRDRIVYPVENRVDIFISQGESAACSYCGNLLHLPPTEKFDIKRSEFGLFLSGMISDIRDQLPD